MPRGGKRAGAGAPKGNQNALKHGARSRVYLGVGLKQKLSKKEREALNIKRIISILSTATHDGVNAKGSLQQQVSRYSKRVKYKALNHYFTPPNSKSGR